jgi:hypothetical protein
MAEEMTPQVIMMRAIHTLAPTFYIIRLLGISKTKYPMKKIPAQIPLIVSLKPKSSFICKAANPTLTRSRNATMYSTNMNGIGRKVIFASVLCPTVFSTHPTFPSSVE